MLNGLVCGSMSYQWCDERSASRVCADTTTGWPSTVSVNVPEALPAVTPVSSPMKPLPPLPAERRMRMDVAATDRPSLETVPTTETRSPTAGSEVPAGMAEVSTCTPRTTKLAAAPPEAAVNAETLPSNSTVAPTVCTGRWLRSITTVGLNVAAGSAGALEAKAETTSPEANAPAQ